MNVRELISKLAELGPEAMEFPVVYVEEIYAVSIGPLEIEELDETGRTTGSGSHYFRDFEHQNQKVVVL